MSGTQISRNSQQPTAGSAIWLTCPDCGTTARVLAVMASRVLKERPQCPKCLSTRVPHLRQSSSGSRISPSEAEQAPLSGEDQAYLLAWIKAQGERGQLHHWLFQTLGRLAARFSRTKRLAVQTPARDTADEHVLHLSNPENDIS